MLSLPYGVNYRTPELKKPRTWPRGSHFFRNIGQAVNEARATARAIKVPVNIGERKMSRNVVIVLTQISNDQVTFMSKNPPSDSLAQQRSAEDAEPARTIDRPPSSHEGLPRPKSYHPFSPYVLALLVPASIFGVLSRLGLQALVTYDGNSIFPLAYVQAVGCLIMGFGLGLKEPIGQL